MDVLDYIDIAVTDPEHVAAAVTKYISDHANMISSLDVKIRVSICKSTQTLRAGKNERQETLNQLISASGVTVWEQGNYRFDFKNNEFSQNGKMLYMTAGEIVALYQKLVRKNDLPGWPAFYANMKYKHGSKFLADVL